MKFMEKMLTGLVGGWIVIFIGAGLQNGFIIVMGMCLYFGTIIYGLIETLPEED